MSIPKPQLRNLLHTSTQRNFVISGVASVVASLYVKFFIWDKNQNDINTYYKHTDMRELYEIQKKNGIFRCINTEAE